jgi:uncharacterized protein
MATSAPRPERVRIAVFARAPVAGAVKTRLAPLLGAEGAARLHRALVRRALETALRAEAEVELWCTPDAGDPFSTACAREFGVRLCVQVGADLGERMGHAISAGGPGRATLLIGSDCPALDAQELLRAAAALATHDAVVIPAEDGGYVLVGLARPASAPFEAVDWGSGRVMAQTRVRLAAAGMRWRELAPSWDVDRPEDYARLQAQGLLAQIGA